MPNSNVSYTGDGVETDYTITFSYLSTDDLVVEVDGVAKVITTDWTLASPTVLRFNSAPADTSAIIIRRDSQVGTAAVTFLAAMLTADDLNTSHLQNLYLHQEVRDELALGEIPVLGSALTSGSALDGYVLTADGAGNVAWEPVINAAGTVLQLEDVVDVTLTSIASGEGLYWDGAGWVNGTPTLAIADNSVITFGDSGDVTMGYNSVTNDWEVSATGVGITADMVFDLDTAAKFRIRDDGTDRVTVDMVNDDFEIHGFDLRVYEVADTDYLNIVHDGTNAVFSESAGNNFLFEGGGNLLLREGGTFAVYDSSNADYIAFAHDGTDVNTTFLGTTDWNITLPTDGQIVIDNGATGYTNAAIRLKGDAPAIMMQDDGAAADNSMYTVGHASEAFRIRLFNDALSSSQDALVVNRTANFIDSVRLFGGTDDVFQTQDHDATGATSGAQVVDHGNTYRDVGFNDIAEEGWAAADTLQAKHAGGSWGKANTTARTLTLEASTSEDFPQKAVCQIWNFGTSANLTISEGAGTTLYKIVNGSGQVDSTGSLTVGPGGICTLYRRDASTYYLMGSEIT